MLYEDRKRELGVLWQGAPAPVYQQPPPQQQPAYGAPQQAGPQYGAPPQQGGPPAYGQPQQQGPPQQYGAPVYGQPGDTSNPASVPLPEYPNLIWQGSFHMLSEDATCPPLAHKAYLGNAASTDEFFTLLWKDQAFVWTFECPHVLYL